MQAQGITQNVSAMQSLTSGKTTKATKATFDSFMSRSASGTGRQEERLNTKNTDNYAGRAGNDVNSSKDDFNQHKISLKSNAQGKGELTEAADLEQIGEEVVSFLKETFGMSEEDIVDVLELLGITPAELVFVATPDAQTVNPVNVDNIKALIMEVHGVEDANLFLTSDQMSGELNEVMDGIQDILSEQLGIDVTNMSQEDSKIFLGFAEKLEQFVTGQEKMPDGKVIDEPSEDVSQAVNTETESEIPVVVEMTEESGTSDTTADSRQTLPEMSGESSDPVAESPIQAFVERLSESFENVRQDGAEGSRVTMNNIVEQVVNHVKIRVLPQTTSMELQLNPESLGRVNLNVTSNNGTATATLTVQNEIAKEALESQLTVLRENLENQGLKVDSVEVNVSEFGFKNPEDSNNKQFGQKKSGNRRFRVDAGREAEEENTAVTAEDRQEGTSVVDYTA